MSRPLSALARRSLAAEHTGEVWLVLLTIDHPDLAEPIRVVHNNENITSRGNLFVGFYFRIDLPKQTATEISRVTLEIDNVDRQIVDALRSISGPPTVMLEVVLASQPDVVEMTVPEMQLLRADYDAIVVSGTLSFEPVLDLGYPADSFTPQSHPGMF